MREAKADIDVAKVVHVAAPGFAAGPVDVVIPRAPRLGAKPGDRRRRTRPAKRIVRSSPRAQGASTGAIKEDLYPAAEMPFESVQLGDLAKSI